MSDISILKAEPLSTGRQLSSPPVSRSFRLSKLIFAFLIIAIAANLSYVVYSLALNGREDVPLENPSSDQATAAAPQPLRAENLKPREYYEQLADQRNIFQFALPAPVEDSPASSPDTATIPQVNELNKLVVSGVILDRVPQAVLKDPATKESFLLKEGETVRGSSVRQILEDRVILDYQGQSVVLKLGGDPS